MLFRSSLAEAFAAWDAAGGDCAWYAGGTELLQVMKMGFARFGTLIDLKRIPELGGIAETAGGGLRIGAAVTHREVERSPLVARRLPGLVRLEHEGANVRVRSTGTLGAAAACARLLGLNEQQTTMALGIAASQPIGLREQFGTMTKPFHPGGAAKVGLMSALMAKHGYTASPRALEAPRGLMQVFSDKTDWKEVTENLGKSWEIELNTYKPFACGIVIHPAIDACVQLREKYNLKPEQVAKVTLKAHPLVQELTGKKTPTDGLLAKFSVFHSCAVALIYGRAGEHEYADEVVRSPLVIGVRDKVELIVEIGRAHV